MKTPDRLPASDLRPRLIVVVPLVVMSFVAAIFIAYDAFEGVERPARVRMTNEVTVFRPMRRPPTLERSSMAPVVEAQVSDADFQKRTRAARKVNAPVIANQPEQAIEPIEEAPAPQPPLVVVKAPPLEVGVVAPRLGGEVTGNAFLRGIPPPEKVLPFDPFIARERTSQATTRFFVVNTNGQLADVFVYVKQGLKTRPPPVKSTAVLEMKGGEFVPQILGLRTGQPLSVRNLDRVNHYIHTVPTVPANHPTNRALTPQHDVTIKFGAPEIFVKVQCDVHSWEFAWIAVVDHPFFDVTDTDGAYQITGLPPGQYTVEAVHRKVGRLTQKVTLKSNASVDGVDFLFDLPSEFTQRR